MLHHSLVAFYILEKVILHLNMSLVFKPTSEAKILKDFVGRQALPIWNIGATQISSDLDLYWDNLGK